MDLDKRKRIEDIATLILAILTLIAFGLALFNS
jgi:hypothetical protein